MSRRSLSWFGLGFLGSALLVMQTGCGPRTEAPQTPSVFTIQGDVIGIDPSSPMLKYLEISPLETSHHESHDLAAVGQIIALANDSDELTGSNISWVELDPEISRSLGFSFGPSMKAEVGEAFGVVSVPAEYLGQLKCYEGVKVQRYGLLKTFASGMVIAIHPPKTNDAEITGEPLQVVFKILKGQDFYPGANCEVDFPVSAGRPVSVASTALLHEGRQEYVLKDLGRARYSPVPVYVLDTMQDSVLVIGDLKPGERIVSRGAILLKPLLHQILRQQSPQTDGGNS